MNFKELITPKRCNPFTPIGWVEIFIVLFACYYTGIYFIEAYDIIPYPYQVFWLEGGSMQVVQRVLAGLPLYTEPSLDYLPYIYTPFYFYVTAAFTTVFGVDFIAGRMVSFVATVATLCILYALMRKEGLSRIMALLAPLFYLAFSANASGWYTLMRVDSLFIVLLFAGLYAYWHYRSTLAMYVAGFLLALALFTKQQAAMICVPLFIAGLYVWPKKTVVAFGVFLAFATALLLLFMYKNPDWFLIYMVTIPATVPKFWWFTKNFLGRDVLIVLPIAIAFSLYFLFDVWKIDRKKALLYSVLLISTGLCSWLSRIHSRADVNGAFTLYTALHILFALGVAHVLARHAAQKLLCYLLVLLHFASCAFGVYNKALPLKNYRKQDELFLDYVRNLPGEVFIPDMQYMQSKAGKRSYVYRDGGHDIYRADFGDDSRAIKDNYRKKLVEALRQKRFSAIILYHGDEMPEKDAYYRFKEQIQSDNDSHTFNGGRILPNTVFVPID
jgi:hypothetical protein